VLTIAKIRCVLASQAAPRAWLELRALLKKKKMGPFVKEAATLTDDQLRRVARSWLETHAWIPETIATAAPGQLEDQKESLPDHWIGLDAAIDDDDGRIPPSSMKDIFLYQLIERQGYSGSPADAEKLAPILAAAIGELIEKRLESLAAVTSKGTEESQGPQIVDRPAPKEGTDKPLSFHLPAFFRRNKALSESTRVSYSAEVARFEGMIGKKAISEITKSDIVRYMDALPDLPGRRGRPLSRITVLKGLSHLRALFDFAVMREFALANPVVGVLPPKEKRGGKPSRRAFKDKELKAIFAHPIFTGCRDDHFIQKSGRWLLSDGRFWIPIVALLSGGRLGELKALRCSDYHVDGGLHFLDITIKPEADDDEDDKKRTLKTENAARRVPIHPKLIELGFLDYIRDRQAAGEKYLFKQIAYGQLMNDRLIKLVAKDNDTSFHSFRHCFAGMVRILQSDETKNRLMGHAPVTVGEGYDPMVSVDEAQLFIQNCRPLIDLDLVPYLGRDKAAPQRIPARRIQTRPVRGLRKKRS
jgi:integrase